MSASTKIPEIQILRHSKDKLSDVNIFKKTVDTKDVKFNQLNVSTKKVSGLS